MARQKTSQARIYPARLNPIHPQEAEVIRILDDYAAQGYNFKQVVVSAVLAFAGQEPSQFQAQGGSGLLAQMETLLRDFIQEFLAGGQAMAPAPAEDDESSGVGEVARNFADSFRRRMEESIEEDEA